MKKNSNIEPPLNKTIKLKKFISHTKIKRIIFIKTPYNKRNRPYLIPFNWETIDSYNTQLNNLNYNSNNNLPISYMISERGLVTK